MNVISLNRTSNELVVHKVKYDPLVSPSLTFAYNKTVKKDSLLVENLKQGIGVFVHSNKLPSTSETDDGFFDIFIAGTVENRQSKN